MKYVVVFGNCQSKQICRFLSQASDPSIYVEHLSNNTRTGNMKSVDLILEKISKSDILIFQPLDNSHGKLSRDSILEVMNKGSISLSFPYIFNNGVYSLCHAPMSKNNSYGAIFGENFIIDLLISGASRANILSDFKNGSINFNLQKRFNKCINIMKERECSTNIKLSDFIKNNYKSKKLFITHNHPTNEVFFEILYQIKEQTKLKLDFTNIDNTLTLSKTNCPISPYDIENHGYNFKEDDDWFAQGEILINLIINEYLEKKCAVQGNDLELSTGTIKSENVKIKHIKNSIDISVIKDEAIALQEVNIYAALRLMEIAKNKRPSDLDIKRKIKLYRSIAE